MYVHSICLRKMTVHFHIPSTKRFVDKPCHTLLFLFFRRSITAGGRLSTAKTRCGTWPKWWDPSLRCQWAISLPLSEVFSCRTLEAVNCFQQASTERTVMHLCFSFFFFCFSTVFLTTPHSCGTIMSRNINLVCSPAQIRGMSIDEAIAQLEFNDKKGAKIMKEVRSCTFTTVTKKCVIKFLYYYDIPIFTALGFVHLFCLFRFFWKPRRWQSRITM